MKKREAGGTKIGRRDFCKLALAGSSTLLIPGTTGFAKDKKSDFTIDLHGHVFVPRAEERVAKHPKLAAMRETERKAMGEKSFTYNLKQMAAVVPKLTDINTRIQDMDRLGIDLQVISPSPTQYHYWADQNIAADIVRDQNEYIAGICVSHSDRFVGLGAVALQHPDLAVKQLVQCMKNYRLKGVEISTVIQDAELSDPRFETFWRSAEEMGAVIFIHPMGSTLGERIAPYYLANIIGQPIETTIALSHIIFSGILDRYPQLRICAAHGGGYLPTYIGRSDHGYDVRPESKGMKHPPSEYLKKIFFDTVVFRADILARIIAIAGIEQVVFGTDYPFDMGDYDIEPLLKGLPKLDNKGRNAIRSGNACRLLQLSL